VERGLKWVQRHSVLACLTAVALVAGALALVWYALKGGPLLTLKGHTDYVNSVAFSPDSKRIVSGGGDGTVKVWDAERGTETLSFKGNTSWISSVTFSPDGKRIASAGGDGMVRVWDADKGIEILTLKGPDQIGSRARSVAFSPDGKRIASAPRYIFEESGGGYMVMVWDAAKGTELLSRHPGDEVFSVAFSPDGKRIATGGTIHWSVKVWDADKGTEILTLGKPFFKGNVREVISVAFSPDGKRITSAGREGTVWVWDMDKGTETMTVDAIAQFHLRGLSAYSVAFSPDGKRIAIGCGSFPSLPGFVIVYDADKGTEVLTLKGHSGQVRSVAFSPDGKRLASASTDKTVKVWDAEQFADKRGR
jgi:WD40 repeat protein